MYRKLYHILVVMAMMGVLLLGGTLAPAFASGNSDDGRVLYASGNGDDDDEEEEEDDDDDCGDGLLAIVLCLLGGLGGD